MTNSTQVNNPLHIVGIGASAGGLDALEQFFDNMPADSGMAFVVIQHLSPDFKSMMDELLSHHTSMPVHLAEDCSTLKANNIYLIPPMSQMTIKDEKLHLSRFSASERVHLPIDGFFNSLAREMGEKAVAMILSGTGSDGTQGIHAIHDSGGLVIVQTPASAQFDGMPCNAINTGKSDFVLSPEQIPAILMEYINDPKAVLSRRQNELEIPEMEDEFVEIFVLLLHSFNLDFSKYKMGTVGRRIRRRMVFLNIAKVSEYVAILSADQKELDALYKDLLIGVTEFFRDQKAFQYLEYNVIPQLFSNLSPGEDLRVWSAGCATGEEAYSLAILLAEKATDINFSGGITVFATDAHKHSLNIASQGFYDRGRLANVSPERMERHFTEEGKDQFRVNAEIRKLLVFSPHNLLSDPPFSNIDLICCRNLLIYLQPEKQQKVISRFHFSMKKNGILFLGSSEGLGGFANEFEVVSSQYKIYRKTSDLKVVIDIDPARKGSDRIVTVPVLKPDRPRLVSLDRQLLYDYDTLLKKYIPPSVLVNEKRQIIHYFGNITEYLKAPEGRVENDMLLMADDNLHVALSASLLRVVKSGQSIVTRNIRITRGKEEHLIDLTVDPIPDEKTQTVHYHIYFEKVRLVEKATLPKMHDEAEMNHFDANSYNHQHIVDLEMELKSTQDNLDATNHLLQTSIEELQATNEELQATNEELRTSNEELHSTNEELHSVNSELERTNSELKQLNIEHDNLLNSIDSGTVFLDKQLRIRKFNPAISMFFTLVPHDIGRPINNIAYHLDNRDQMLTDLQSVLASGHLIEKEVTTFEGKWLLKRIMPYRNEIGGIEGVILSFTDISRIKEVEQKISRLNEDLAKANAGLNKEVSEREHAQIALKVANEELEIRVAERTEELENNRAELERQNAELLEMFQACQVATAERIKAVEELREKEQVLIQQNRMAAMGEMLGYIAHQWRQPLNVLGMKVQELGLSYELGGFSKELLDANTTMSMDIIKHMSQTIDDFRNLSLPNKDTIVFRVDQVVEKTVSLVAGSFKEQNIAIEVSTTGDLEINGYPNEYAQVILNILMNARDAFLDREMKDGRIMLRSWTEAGRVVLTITDNAGGIDEEIIGRIFDAYFTTKALGKGTGVGLFMSRTIIEQNMGGRLTVRNVGDGVEFRIEV